MNAALGLYDRDHSEKEYWVWESDGSEANFTHWNPYANKLGTSEPESNGCVNFEYNVTAVWDDYRIVGDVIEKDWNKGDWNNQNCYSNTYPVLCQRMVPYDYDCKYTKENCLETSTKQSFTPGYYMFLG